MVDEKDTSPQMNDEKPEVNAPKSMMTFQEFMEAQRMMGAVRHRKAMDRDSSADDTRGRGSVLALLKMADGVATREMAHVLGIRVSSLNETLAKMERDGLIERTPSEDDKRIMLVSLTEAGRAQAESQKNRLPERMFTGFDDDELDQFTGFLERVVENLIDELGEDGRKDLEAMREARNRMAHMHGHGHDGCGPEHGGPRRKGGGHGPGRGGYGGGFSGPAGHGPRRHHHPRPGADE